MVFGFSIANIKLEQAHHRMTTTDLQQDTESVLLHDPKKRFIEPKRQKQ